MFGSAMGWIRLTSAVLLVVCSRLSATAPSFSGEFEITGLEIDSPFEADPKSISNTTVSCKWTMSSITPLSTDDLTFGALQQSSSMTRTRRKPSQRAAI